MVGSKIPGVIPQDAPRQKQFLDWFCITHTDFPGESEGAGSSLNTKALCKTETNCVSLPPQHQVEGEQQDEAAVWWGSFMHQNWVRLGPGPQHSHGSRLQKIFGGKPVWEKKRSILHQQVRMWIQDVRAGSRCCCTLHLLHFLELSKRSVCLDTAPGFWKVCRFGIGAFHFIFNKKTACLQSLSLELRRQWKFSSYYFRLKRQWGTRFWGWGGLAFFFFLCLYFSSNIQEKTFNID